MYYKETGEGIPVVILHGAMLDHTMMEACLEPVFSEVPGYKRYYLDLPGMGNTVVKDDIDSSDQILDLLEEFIENHLSPEKFLLIGQSYGAYLARGLLRKYESRIAGMILLCPMIVPDKEKRRVPMHEILEYDLENVPEAEREVFTLYSGMFVRQNETTWKRFVNEIYCGIRKADTAFLNRLQRGRYSFSFPVPDTEKVFSFPTLIFTGKQDCCVGYEDAIDLMKFYSRASFILADKAGHNLQIERETLFSLAVEDFLSEQIKAIS